MRARRTIQRSGQQQMAVDEVVTEHAVLFSDGSMCVRKSHPDLDRIYPLAQWMDGQIRVNRAHVYRRRVIVVDDWVEVGCGAGDAVVDGDLC
jgi:hypothetical protein